MNSVIQNVLRRSQGKPIVEPVKDEWDVVSAVYDSGVICRRCEYLDKHGDCRLLSQDNMIAKFCFGFEDERDNLTSFPRAAE